MEVREPSAKYLARPAYKQTEVGVIPEDWEIPALSELITEMRGGAPLRPSDFTDSGVKVLPKGGVGRTGWLRVQDSEMQFCSTRYARAHRRNQVDETFTIVVLRDLVPSGPSIGLMVKIREPETYVLAQGVYGFKTNDRAVPSYLVQFSNTIWYRKLANSIMVGSTQVHITNSAFKQVRVPLPTKAEQEAIAEALSDADALIESLDQLIAKKRQIKQGAMQELLTGKRRLPGFSGAWEVKRVAEFGDVVTGGTPRIDVKEYWGEGYPWITPTDISLSRDLTTSERTVTESGLNLLRTLPANTVLVTCIASIGKNAILRFKGGCNQQINAVISNERNSPEFLYYLFEASKQYLLANAGTTATSIISKTTFEEMTFVVPFLTEQTAIATVLSDMDAELEALESRLAKARQIKQGMMQELLTGRIRLV
jgi:type I restriction enzyme S subunit